MLVATSSVGGKRDLSCRSLEGVPCFGSGFNGRRRDEFFAIRRKEFRCEREGNSKVV